MDWPEINIDTIYNTKTMLAGVCFLLGNQGLLRPLFIDSICSNLRKALDQLWITGQIGRSCCRGLDRFGPGLDQEKTAKKPYDARLYSALPAFGPKQVWTRFGPMVFQ